MGNFGRDDRGGNRRGGGGRSFGARRDFGGGGRSFGDRPRSNFGGPRRSFGDRPDREMFKTTCSNCGKDCEVPFRPTSGKPVYCSDCFEKMGGREQGPQRSERSERFERPESRSQEPASNANRAQFDALNMKLDRILKLLEPEVTETVSEVVTEEEIKAPKVKKVAKKSTSKK